MTEEVSFYYNKVAMAYGSASDSQDSFDFVTADAGATAEEDQTDWISLLSISGDLVRPMSEPADGGGLRSDGDLVQSVSDADMSGDFIL